ncbi:MAG: electron transport complex subunit RsxC [bacterium]
MKTFKGGIHLDHHKELTAGKPIREANAPKTVVIHLSQGGAPCQSCVKAGDTVKVGQKLGDSDKLISAPVHSSVSGTVTAIDNAPHPSGTMSKAVYIESDGKNDPVEPIRNISVREAGIVGLGGGSFPSHIKLNPPIGKNIDTVILNGAECEPYITCDHALMLEEPLSIVKGLMGILNTVGAKQGIIAIENNKIDAYNKIREAVNQMNIKVELVETKYPEGGEKELIYALLKREVPSGKFPADIGCIVSNVGTAHAMNTSQKNGMPLTERVLTVTGAVKNPSNLKVKIGTKIIDLIDDCGGFSGKPKKVILGGPMMGISQHTLETPIAKCTTCVLVLDEKDVKLFEEQPCIRCCRCVDSCPVQLMPNFIADYAQNDMFEKAISNGAGDCMECGVCSYVCPTRRELVHWIKLAKAKRLVRRSLGEGGNKK